MTAAQTEALRWLREHNGDGLFDKHGTLVAAGEVAPHTRSTWNKLRAAGLVEYYNGKRVRVISPTDKPEGE